MVLARASVVDYDTAHVAHMNDTPKVSVIIPTYNRSTLVRRAIDSVLAQTMQDLEIIVVDDASTDGTGAMIQKVYRDPRVRYEHLPTNQGVHAARNRGLDLSCGEYIVFLDSDDEVFPHALERMLVAIKRDPAFGMVGAPYRLDDGALTGFERVEDCEIPFVDLLCQRGTRSNKSGLALLSRSAIGDTRFAGKNLDFIFYRTVASRTRFWYIIEPLGAYHLDADAASMTRARKIPNPGLSIVRARATADFLDAFGSTMMAGCPSLFGFYAYGAAVGLLLAGDTRARTYAWQAARCQPRAKYILFCCFAFVPYASWMLWRLFSIRIALRRVL